VGGATFGAGGLGFRVASTATKSITKTIMMIATIKPKRPEELPNKSRSPPKMPVVDEGEGYVVPVGVDDPKLSGVEVGRNVGVDELVDEGVSSTLIAKWIVPLYPVAPPNDFEYAYSIHTS